LFFTIAFRSRASKGIYAQRIALNLSVYGENYDDIVGVVTKKYLLILKMKTSICDIMTEAL
jgi:hypothetical protein